jgi:photosystem II stability/assembly factor-like uncharacterized protein
MPISVVSLTVGTALLYSPSRTLRTQDAGRTWNPVAPDSGFWDVRFSSPTEGWGVDVQRTIWATHDGGLTWRPLAAQP